MAKNLIIGASVGYNYNQLKPWVESIDGFNFDGDKVLIIGNTDENTVTQLMERNFTLVPIPEGKLPFPIHVMRFLLIYDYLYRNKENYNKVITTDVKDVYFQSNPFISHYMDIYNLVVGSESMKYEDEPWGNENLLQTFGPYIHNQFKTNLIYNVGVLGGQIVPIMDLCLSIFQMAINRPIPIVDQAVFNVIIQTYPWRAITYFANQNPDHWTCHAGTTVDPSKIENFRPFLLDKEPYFKDGVVYNNSGNPFSIVHQYDRVPEWKKYIQEKYNQEDESKYFTYKV